MKSAQYLLLLSAGLGILNIARPSHALPPPEEVPEEKLRTEIILEARSPLTGAPITVAEYEQLQSELAQSPPPTLSPQIREIILLLQVRRVLKPIIPILP
ncbi:MAG: hypothetical protein ACFBSG_06730 [Leptolyngbyaceae cyanobacterium]